VGEEVPCIRAREIVAITALVDPTRRSGASAPGIRELSFAEYVKERNLYW
jgi:hypothetical protein